MPRPVAAVNAITVAARNSKFKLAAILEVLLLISTLVLSLLAVLGCTSTSPGVPNIYTLELELEPCKTSIRVGYFGICAVLDHDLRDAECARTQYGTQVDDIYNTAFKRLLEDPSHKRPKDNCEVKDVLRAALDFQWRIFQVLEVGALAFLGPTIFFGWLWAKTKTARQGHKQAVYNANTNAEKIWRLEGGVGPKPVPAKPDKYTSKRYFEALFLVCLFFSATLSGAAALSVWQAADALEYTSSSPLFRGKVPIHRGLTLITLQGIAAALAFVLFIIVILFQRSDKEEQAYAWTFSNKLVTPAAAKPAGGPMPGGPMGAKPPGPPGPGRGGPAPPAIMNFNIVSAPSGGHNFEPNTISGRSTGRVGGPPSVAPAPSAPKTLGGGTQVANQGSVAASRGRFHATVEDDDEGVAGSPGGSGQTRKPDTNKMNSLGADSGSSNVDENVRPAKATPEPPGETEKKGNAKGIQQTQGNFVVNIDPRLLVSGEAPDSVKASLKSFGVDWRKPDAPVVESSQKPASVSVTRESLPAPEPALVSVTSKPLPAPPPPSTSQAEEMSSSSAIENQVTPRIIPPLMPGAIPAIPKQPKAKKAKGPLQGFAQPEPDNSWMNDPNVVYGVAIEVQDGMEHLFTSDPIIEPTRLVRNDSGLSGMEVKDEKGKGKARALIEDENAQVVA